MSEFVHFARSHGLILDYAIADGRFHRTPTEDKPRKKNGAYVFDGARGAVRNFATMIDYASFRDGARAGNVDKAAIRARLAIAEAATKARQAEASQLAVSMIKRAAHDIHPYLAAKGFPEERGLVLESELLIPMREFSRYSQVNSVQRISADGAKLFLQGGKAKGSVFFIGPLVPNERWLVEGYATGLSVRAALRELHREAQVIVCFSDGNLAHVGQIVKELRPRAYVFADNDESGAGQKAAERTGLPWCMASDVGLDANDLHQQQGLRALVRLMRDGLTTNEKRDERAVGTA